MMRLMEILETVDKASFKDGEMTFKYFDDFKDGINRGWVVDMVKAYVNDQEVGYLKISYIPTKNMNEIYPDVVTYMGRLGGWSDLEYALENNDKKEIVKALSRRTEYPSVSDLEFRKELTNADEKWWDDKYNELYKKVTELYKERYLKFKSDWENCPLVDYIRITDENFKGKGIGLNLYISGAKWMAEKGMCLHASTLQSAEAIKAWERMKKLGLPVKAYKNKMKRARVCLDYR